MSDIVAIALALAFAVGILLGIVYFGGLWLTVTHLPRSRRPALLAIGSFTGRTLLILAAMYMFVKDGHWDRLVAWLLGFVLARFVVINRTRPKMLEQRTKENR